MSSEPLEVAHRVLESTGLEVTRVAPLRKGREHHIFRVEFAGGHLRLLKLPREDGIGDPYWPGRTWRQSFRAEREAISLVQGIDVPQPYHVLPTDPPASLMGIVPGTTPEVVYERGMMDRSLLEAVCHQMGGLLATIHETRRPDSTQIPTIQGYPSSKLRLLHMDFHLGNVLGAMRTGARWRPTGVIDWTWAKWGPREADFAEMCVSVFITNSWGLEPMLSGYREVSHLQLEPKAVFRWAIRDLKRRLHHEPPSDETMLELWKTTLSAWEEGRYF